MGRAFIIAVSILCAFAASAALVPAAAQESGESYGADAGQERLAPRQLDALLAPIALYPDQLLAPVLMAATYPRDVDAAADWTRSAVNASLNPDALAFALEPMEWDPSVKTLAQFPDVLRMLSSEWDWIVRVGNAFLLQESDVMGSIQRLRHQAYAAGQLRSTDLHRVRFDNGAIIIDMVQPGMVYVPRYDPVRAYGPWAYPDLPPYHFRRPVTVTRYFVVGSLWGWSSWDWQRHQIRVDRARYYYFARLHPWRFDDGRWRHDRRRGWDGHDWRRRPGRPDAWPSDARRGDHRRDDRSDDRRGDGDWNRRGGGSPDIYRDRRGDHRADRNRDARLEWRRRDPWNGGDLNTDRRSDFRGYRGPRREQPVYAGPQLTPPPPLAPLPQEPRMRRAPRPDLRDMSRTIGHRGDDTAVRPQVPGDGGGRFRAGGGEGRFRGPPPQVVDVCGEGPNPGPADPGPVNLVPANPGPEISPAGNDGEVDGRWPNPY